MFLDFVSQPETDLSQLIFVIEMTVIVSMIVVAIIIIVSVEKAIFDHIC